MTRPQIVIEGLRLHLPAEFAGRAETLVRLVAEQLALAPWSGSIEHDRLELRGLRFAAGATEREVAATIVTAIFARLGGHHA